MAKLIITSTLSLLRTACATSTVTDSPPAVSSTTSRTPWPASEVRPVTETVHGVSLTDPYRWLEDQESPETRAWIERQNAHTDAVLGTRPEPAIFVPRLTQLMSTDQYSTPQSRAGRYFFTRRKVGEDLYSIYMREGASGADQLLVDPAPMSSDHTTSVGISDVAADGRTLAYYVRKGGADEVEIRFFDVDARRDIGTPLNAGRYYGVSIAPDRQSIYFTRMMPNGPRVFRRALSGTDETMLFGEGYGREKILFNSLSDDGRYHLIHVFHGSAPKKTEIYVDDLTDDAPARTVVNDLDFRSSAELAGDSLVIQTNWNAPNDRVMVVSAANPGRDNWKETVPENPKAAIQGTSNAGGRVYVSYLEDVKPRIVGYDLTATQRPELAGAVVCRYPLIDMVRYHKFLVGSYWTPEYGDPEKAKEFAWVYAYSPYHRVKKGTDYPATLFITGDADTRVAPLHARKMTALMQAVDGDSDPILLRYHTAFGHSGGEPLPVQVKNLAEEMGFMWWQLK